MQIFIISKTNYLIILILYILIPNILRKVPYESTEQRAFGDHQHLVNAKLNAFIIEIDWITNIKSELAIMELEVQVIIFIYIHLDLTVSCFTISFP